MLFVPTMKPSISPDTKDAYNLFHFGSQVLAKMEYHGIRIDVPYCRVQQKKIQKEIRDLERGFFQETKLGKVWRNSCDKRRTTLNIDSGAQLGYILYKVMAINPPRETDKGNPSVDKFALFELATELPELHDLLKLRRMKKLDSTYFDALLRYEIDGFIHPNIDLSPRTYRSNSSEPNIQNFPIRDLEIGSRIRRAIIARKGRRIISADYSGIEVKVGACYHKDPEMIRYLKDKSSDMHRDMAMELFLLDKEQVSKDTRYSAKNGFVFPEFYGDYFGNCAFTLWRYIRDLKLTLEGTKISLYDHLKNQKVDAQRLKRVLQERGRDMWDKKKKEEWKRFAPMAGARIDTLKAFEAHVFCVEHDFWNKKFRVYNEWKKNWVKAYDKRGYLRMFTGFSCSGYMEKNQIANYPNQGTAFHCALFSLIWMQSLIEKRKMNSLQLFEIHDDISLDVPENEKDDVVAMMQEVMVEKLMKTWKWIIVPIDIEIKMSEVDGNWFEQKRIV